MRYILIGTLISIAVIGAASCIYYCIPSDTPRNATHPVLAASPPFMEIDGRKFDTKCKGSFTLTNQSGKSLTIRGVEVGCSLCLQATNLAGASLGPGESCSLDVETEPPAVGIDTHKVKVIYDGSDSPLTLTVEVVGRGKVPYVIATIPTRVTFFDLESVQRTQTIRVTTCEPAGDPPWLTSLTSDVREVTFSGGPIESHQHGPVVQRIYEYKIGWTEMPTAKEFFGTIYAIPSVNSSSEIRIGLLACTVATPARPAKTSKIIP